MFYRPEGKAVCADVIPFFEGGEFKLFYLRDYRDWEAHGEGCPWCLVTGEKLSELTDHGPVLLRGTKQEQDLYVFTGCCMKVGEEYMIFYTGHNPHLRAQGLPEQKILRATSKDLLHWEKDPNFVFEAPEWLEIHDFRDPFVYFDEEKGKYGMLIAARLKNDLPVNAKGVTLVAYSDDLEHWDLQKEPFYAPNAYFTHECPDLFKMGDWWYLVFSEFTDKILTTYRMSKSMNGPWITPKVNTFDNHVWYAAKSTTDGERRIMFGWNRIKDKEEDLNYWQWGGSIVPHELVQAEDGTLYVKCPEEVRNFYHEPLALEDGRQYGEVKAQADAVDFGAMGKSVKLLGKMPENCRMEMKFTLGDDCGDFGVVLRSDESIDNYYVAKLEPRHNRLAFDKVPHMLDTAGYKHVQIETERYCPLEVGVEHTMTVICEGSVLEVYVDDKVAMSSRMFDLKNGSWGLYSHNMQVSFRDIRFFG